MNKNIIILIISVALISLFKTTDLGFSFWKNPELNTKYIHTPSIPVSISTDISIFGLFSDFYTQLSINDNFEDSKVSSLDFSSSEPELLTDVIPITKQEEKPPPPPEVIEIIEDDEEIENEAEVEDTESDEDVEIEIEEEDDEEFFMVVENMPEFPGGDIGLMNFLKKNLRYPEISKQYNITGKVYVSFIVDKSGSVTNVKIVRGVDKNLDAEAMRVVKSLPKYKPGKQRGKSVRVMFTIPINFTLSTNNFEKTKEEDELLIKEFVEKSEKTEEVDIKEDDDNWNPARSDEEIIQQNPNIKENAKKLLLESLQDGIITIDDVQELLSNHTSSRKKVKKGDVKDLIKKNKKRK